MKNETIQTKTGLQVVKVYDSGPNKGADRYTVYYMNRAEWGIDAKHDPMFSRTGAKLYPYFGMGGAPFHPQGIAQHGEGILGKHNGKRIPFAELPEDCRKAVLQDFAE